jgi:hypothetical protein
MTRDPRQPPDLHVCSVVEHDGYEYALRALLPQLEAADALAYSTPSNTATVTKQSNRSPVPSPTTSPPVTPT